MMKSEDLLNFQRYNPAMLESTKKLKKSEEDLRIIAEVINDLITVIDHNGYVEYVPPSYKKSLGYEQTSF